MRFFTLVSILAALVSTVVSAPTEELTAGLAKRDCIDQCGFTFAACGTSNACSASFQRCLGACVATQCPRDLEGRKVC
ncbi:hypothetical protein B0H13DRAFT_2360776 [Mycena leptocephala]|nr:hypothetical protein B0H13DRAFT_2360776 [Mycena leptocephala]